MKIIEKPGRAYERICLYGPPKVGKTTLATSLPWGEYWGERALYVGYDAGVRKGATDAEVESAASSALKSVLDENKGRLIIVVPTGEPNWMEEAVQIAKTDWRKNYPELRTIIIDPLTELSRRILREYADSGVFSGGRRDKDSHNVQVGLKSTGSWHTSPIEGDYGAVQNTIAFLHEHLWTQAMHLIVVFHEDVADSDTGGDGMVGGPQTVGKKAIRWVPAKYDTVLYMQRVQVSPEKSTVVVNTQQRGIWRAGIRNGNPEMKLPPQIPLDRNPVEFWNKLPQAEKGS